MRHSPFRRRLRLGLAASLAVAGLVLASALPAHATYYSGGMPSATFQIKPYSYNSTWQTPMDAAISSWNATSSPADISKNSASSAYVTAASYPDTWYGYYSPSGIPAFRTFDIKLNSTTISAAATNFSNFVRSVFVHELGHALSLDDNPSTTSTSIMKDGRPRNSMVLPQIYDINDVNAFY